MPFHNPTINDMWIKLSLVYSPTAEWENEYEWEARDFAIDSTDTLMYPPY